MLCCVVLCCVVLCCVVVAPIQETFYKFKRLVQLMQTIACTDGLILSVCMMKYYYDTSICHVSRLANLDVLLHPVVMPSLTRCF